MQLTSVFLSLIPDQIVTEDNLRFVHMFETVLETSLIVITLF